MTKYCAIEGSGYAGKTTIVHSLSEKGFPVVGEYDEFVDLNGSAAEDKIGIANALIDAERIRTDLAGRVSGGIVFSDRSVLSLLTYYDMVLMCEVGDREENLRVRDHILDRIDREVFMGNIALMNTLIVVRLNQNEFSRRVSIRGVTPVQQLADFAVAQYITSQATEYGRQILGVSSVTEIDVSGLTKTDAADTVLDASNRLPKAETLQRRFNELR